MKIHLKRQQIVTVRGKLIEALEVMVARDDIHWDLEIVQILPR